MFGARPLGAGVAVLSSLVVGFGCSGTTTEPTIQPTHPAGTSLQALPLGGRPHGVAVARDGTFFVSQIDGASATRGRLREGAQTLEQSVRVGDGPAHVAVDARGTFAYTTNQHAGTVSVVNVASNSVVATVPLPSDGFNLIVSPDGARVFATSADGTVTVIDAATHRAITSGKVGSAPNGLAYDARRDVLYVSSRDAATVTALDPATAAVRRVYAVSGSPQRLALTRDGSTLYVASERDGLVALDPATGAQRVIRGVSAGAVGLGLSPDDEQLYVTNPPAGIVEVVDRKSGGVLRTYTGLRPRNVAFDARGTTAVVTDEGGAVLFIR